jgi:NRPS condensation-like uncharacterized protein
METNPHSPWIKEDITFPCQPIRAEENRQFLFRVLYYDRNISLEVFHALSDGSGGLVFLKTLVAQYFRRLGREIPAGQGILDIHEKPHPEEMEDAYNRYANFRVIHSRREQTAYHLKLPKLPIFMLKVVEGTIPITPLLAKAHEYKVSLTELMTAILLEKLLDMEKSNPDRYRSKPVKVSVPVNMRKYFPSQTLRNFSLYVNTGIDPQYGDYTFEEILHQVHHYMRYQLNGKFLNAQMCGNVASERNPLLRVMPLFIKNAAMGAAYRLSGERYFTTTLTNLGTISVPSQLQREIEAFVFTLGPAQSNSVHCAACSYGDHLRIVFSGTTDDTQLETAFFRRIVGWGIPVKVVGNG